MSVGDACLRLLAVALLLVDAAAASGAEDLPGRLRQVERAFRDGDATTLRLSIVTDGKVRVGLRDMTDGQGWYSPGQLQVLFARVFAEHVTREIAFGPEGVVEPTPGTAFARGRWVRRARGGGPEVVDTVVLTLREQGGDWRVIEIRTAR